MSLGVAYSYCINLTEEEKFQIDKQVGKSKFELKFAIFFPLIPFLMPQTFFFTVERFFPKQIVSNAINRAQSALAKISATQTTFGFAVLFWLYKRFS